MRGSALAALVAPVALAAVLGACGGGSPGLFTPIRPVALPPGYQRIGGVGQGLYLAVPKSWTVFDLAVQTPAAAFMTLLEKTDSSDAIGEFRSFASPLGPVHGVYATDLHSTAFATSLSAYCTRSGTNQSGRAGLPLLRGATSHLTSRVQDVRRTDVRLGTVPGLELTYSESKPGVSTLYGAQFDALPVGGTLCVINLYAMGGLPAGVISEITRTVQYL